MDRHRAILFSAAAPPHVIVVNLAAPRPAATAEEIDVPFHDDTSTLDLGDLALTAASWRRVGAWHHVDGCWCAPVVSDGLDQLERDQQIGDQRRSGKPWNEAR